MDLGNGTKRMASKSFTSGFRGSRLSLSLSCKTKGIRLVNCISRFFLHSGSNLSLAFAKNRYCHMSFVDNSYLLSCITLMVGCA